jgi:hypothetical protein
MGDFLGLGIIILVILAIAALRQHKRLVFGIYLVALFLVIPLLMPGLFLPVLGGSALIYFFLQRMKS